MPSPEAPRPAHFPRVEDYRHRPFPEAHDLAAIREAYGDELVEFVEFKATLADHVTQEDKNILEEGDRLSTEEAAKSGHLKFYFSDTVDEDGNSANVCGWDDDVAPHQALHGPEHMKYVRYAIGKKLYKRVEITIWAGMANDTGSYDTSVIRQLNLSDIEKHLGLAAA